MDTYQKLYTVDDIAKMTMLTSRTIRNYLKDGTLKGRKVGGQWRFTKDDVEKLFDNGTVAEEMISMKRQDVLDFIDGVKTDLKGDMQICTIVDYYCESTEVIQLLNERLQAIINKGEIGEARSYNYEYLNEENKARYTLFGDPLYIKEVMSLLHEEYLKNKVEE